MQFLTIGRTLCMDETTIFRPVVSVAHSTPCRFSLRSRYPNLLLEDFDPVHVFMCVNLEDHRVLDKSR